MSKGITYGYGKEISDILGIQNITDLDIHIPLDGLISADVKFLLTTEQCDKLLKSASTLDDLKAKLRSLGE